MPPRIPHRYIDEVEVKQCGCCKEWKPLGAFSMGRATADKLQRRCRVCYAHYRAGHLKEKSDWSKRWREEHPEKEKANNVARHARNPQRNRDADLQRKYGITLAQYNARLQVQEGKCAICGRTTEENGRVLAVDHCHETGQNRALLCHQCNSMLGMAGDSPELLRKAANYIGEWQEAAKAAEKEEADE